MKKEKIKINKIPCILWGESSKSIYIYIHGQGGYKEEAESFAKIAIENDKQVLSIDLPEHGERKNEIEMFYPWNVIPELKQVMVYVKQNWNRVSLYANSIGAWFSMLSFQEEEFENCLFVSPILNMEYLISTMMHWANISEEQLEEQKTIPTSFGQTLSWNYFCYTKKNKIIKWNVPTKILYAENDNLTERDVVDKFIKQFKCDLTIMKHGEHWFHTPEQLEFLNTWTKNNI